MITEERLLFSASQVTLYRECARKWAWRYLAGIKSPQHAAAALGQEVDDEQLQPYLRDGRPLDFSRQSGSGYIAAAGLAYLPQPKTPGLVVQKYFCIPSPTWIDKIGPEGRSREHIGFAFQGYMDLWLPDSKLVPDMPGGAPFVGDFKTTGDLKWAKTEKDLATDVQAQLYATAAMFSTGARTVDLAWIYFQTRGTRKSKRTYLRVVGDQVAEQFGKINETALEMREARIANPAPLDLPPNPEMCEAYGGCPYRDRCNLSPAQIIEALDAKSDRLANALGLNGDTTMANTNAPNQTSNLLASMRAKKAAQGGQAGTAVPPAQAPVAQPAQPSPPATLPRPPVPGGTLPDPRYAIVAQRPDGSPVYAYELQGLPAPINPPESQLPPAAATGVAQVPTTPPAQAAPVEAPKRGRPRRAAPDPKGADALAAITPAPTDPSQLLLATTPGPAPAPAAAVVNISAEVGELVKVAKAMRAGCDAFLAAMGE